jgi:hypothetical protein
LAGDWGEHWQFFPGNQVLIHSKLDWPKEKSKEEAKVNEADLAHFREMTIAARLRAIKETEEVRQRADEEKETEQKEQRAKAQLQERLDELKALQVIIQIPNRMETEARAGRGHAILMSVGYKDYERPHTKEMNWNMCRAEWLKGACRLVYQHCQESELKPTIEFWHDGVGVNSGFNIVIHWM